MARDNFFQETDEGNLSQFNAGMLQMKRIHDLQQVLNYLNTNLLFFDPIKQQWNYILKLYVLDSLYQEVRPKLPDKDKLDTDNFKAWIRKVLKTHNPHQRKKGRDGDGKTLFVEANWEKFEEILFKYESVVRDHLETRRMNSPNAEDDEGL